MTADDRGYELGRIEAQLDAAWRRYQEASEEAFLAGELFRLLTEQRKALSATGSAEAS